MRFEPLLFALPSLLLPSAAESQIEVTYHAGWVVGIADVRVGGSRSLSPEACSYGYVDPLAPVISLQYVGRGGPLYVYVAGEGDTMLTIRTPDGEVLCNDDGWRGSDPLIEIPQARDGTYVLLAGAYARGEVIDARVYISSTRPGSTSTSSSSSVEPFRESGLVLNPTHGSVTLDSGFTPDPHTLTVSAGGSMDVGVTGCDYGYVSAAPTYTLDYTGSGTDLSFYARSGDDTMLLINDLNHLTWVCDDDSFGDRNPVVTFPDAAPGLYIIWVGTYNPGAPVSATLHISKRAPQ